MVSSEDYDRVVSAEESGGQTIYIKKSEPKSSSKSSEPRKRDNKAYKAAGGAKGTGHRTYASWKNEQNRLAREAYKEKYGSKPQTQTEMKEAYRTLDEQKAKTSASAPAPAQAVPPQGLTRREIDALTAGYQKDARGRVKVGGMYYAPEDAARIIAREGKIEYQSDEETTKTLRFSGNLGYMLADRDVTYEETDTALVVRFTHEGKERREEILRAFRRDLPPSWTMEEVGDEVRFSIQTKQTYTTEPSPAAGKQDVSLVFGERGLEPTTSPPASNIDKLYKGMVEGMKPPTPEIKFEKIGVKYEVTFGGKPYSQLSTEQKQSVDTAIRAYMQSPDYQEQLDTVRQITGTGNLGIKRTFEGTIASGWEFKEMKAWGFALGVKETYGDISPERFKAIAPPQERTDLSTFEKVDLAYNPPVDPSKTLEAFFLRSAQVGHAVNKELAKHGITNISEAEARAVDYKLNLGMVELAEAGQEYKQAPTFEKAASGFIQASAVTTMFSTPFSLYGSSAAIAARSAPTVGVEAVKFAPQIKTFLIGGTVAATIEESSKIVSVPEHKPFSEPKDTGIAFVAGGGSAVAFGAVRGAIKVIPQSGLTGSLIETTQRLSASALAGGTSGAGYSVTKDVLKGEKIDVERATQYAAVGAAVGVGFEAAAIGFEKGLIPKPVVKEVAYKSLSTGKTHYYRGVGFEFRGKGYPLVGYDRGLKFGTPKLSQEGVMAFPMAETPFETAILKPAYQSYAERLGKLPAAERALVQKEIVAFAKSGKGMDSTVVEYLTPKQGGLGVVSTRFKTGYPTMEFTYYSKDPTVLKMGLKDVLKGSELLGRGATKISALIQKEKASVIVFGSGSQKMFMGGSMSRNIRDIDLMLISKSPEKFAQQIVKELKPIYGSKIRINPQKPALVEIQIKGKWAHAFDIKSKFGDVVAGSESQLLSAEYVGYGMPVKAPFITKDGQMLMPLSEQGARKWASSLTMRSFGVSPEAHRLKDVFDALEVAQFKATIAGRQDILQNIAQFKSTIPESVTKQMAQKYGYSAGSSYLILPQTYSLPYSMVPSYVGAGAASYSFSGMGAKEGYEYPVKGGSLPPSYSLPSPSQKSPKISPSMPKASPSPNIPKSPSIRGYQSPRLPTKPSPRIPSSPSPKVTPPSPRIPSPSSPSPRVPSPSPAIPYGYRPKVPTYKPRGYPYKAPPSPYYGQASPAQNVPSEEIQIPQEFTMPKADPVGTRKKRKKEKKKKGYRFEGVRSLFSDLFSVAGSQLKYGKATHPSLRKRPYLWTTETGRTPTVEQLQAKQKNKKVKRKGVNINLGKIKKRFGK